MIWNSIRLPFEIMEDLKHIAEVNGIDNTKWIIVTICYYLYTKEDISNNSAEVNDWILDRGPKYQIDALSMLFDHTWRYLKEYRYHMDYLLEMMYRDPTYIINIDISLRKGFIYILE